MLMMVQGKFHPWMGLALAIVAGAALLVLILKPAGDAPAPPPAILTTQSPTSRHSEPAPAAAPASTPAPAALSAEALEKFRASRRRSALRASYDALVISPATLERFLAGRPRDAAKQALDDLRVRVAHDDRAAAAALFRTLVRCGDGSGLRNDISAAEAEITATAARQAPPDRLRARAALDIAREQSEFDAALCEGGAPDNNPALMETVRNAASDGDTPSLVALATAAAQRHDEASEERYLLSASLLGDPDGQWQLARLYQKRLAADPNGKDRGKMRFWLEQAADKIPAATYTLGDCLRTTCDGLAANPDRARRLIETAAQKGDRNAIDAMIRDSQDPGTGDRLADYAWVDFRARLADSGCDAGYFFNLVEDPRAGLHANLLSGERIEADERARDLYERYGASARAQLGCE